MAIDGGDVKASLVLNIKRFLQNIILGFHDLRSWIIGFLMNSKTTKLSKYN